MYKEMDLYTQIAFILVLVGGILWGFYGLFGVNLLTAIFGPLARVVDIIVGVAAGWFCYRIYVEKFKRTV